MGCFSNGYRIAIAGVSARVDATISIKLSAPQETTGGTHSWKHDFLYLADPRRKYPIVCSYRVFGIFSLRLCVK